MSSHDVMALPGPAARLADSGPPSWPSASDRPRHSPDEQVTVAGSDAPPQPPRPPGPDELAPGTTISRYMILSRLGSGAMGVVYAAYDPELDRKVALKLLHPRGGSTLDSKVRLMREAKALARLSHPNVVAVHDVGTFAERVFLAMEFVDGRTLGAWLKSQPGPQPWRDVLAIMRKAGEGLAAAHAAGLIHRDFKPKPSRPPPKAPLSAKRRGSPTIGAFEGRRFAQEWSEVVRMAQSWPKIEARSCHTPSEA